MERFGLSEIQANAILAMRLGRLSALDVEKIENELRDITKRIEELEAILGDIHLVDNIIKTEIKEISDKFGDDRRTSIETIGGEMDIEDLIPVEDRVVTLTHFGYIKSQSVDTYKAQRRGGRGISGMTRRDEDFVENLFVASTHDFILFFTSKGRVFRIKGYEIPESQRAARGANIINLLQIEQDEKVTAMIKIGGVIDDENTYLTMITKQGVIKRTRLTAYRNVRKGGLNAISLDEGDELKWVRLTGGEDELIVATHDGMAIRFAESDARELGRTARGVKAIALDEGDEVVGVEVVTPGKRLLTVSESGQGRRTDFEDYRIQNRGGKGIQNYKNGEVAGIKAVLDDDDVILISDDGVIIRINVGEINVQSRYAAGVRVMRIGEGNRVVNLAVAPRSADGDKSEDEDIPEGTVEHEDTETENNAQNAENPDAQAKN